MASDFPIVLRRIPADGEFRGNLAAGGQGLVQPLSDRDRWIAEQIAPTLKEKGSYFCWSGCNWRLSH
jgi:glutathione synthase